MDAEAGGSNYEGKELGGFYPWALEAIQNLAFVRAIEAACVVLLPAPCLCVWPSKCTCSEPTKSMVEEEPRVSKLNIPPPGEGRRGVLPKFASIKHSRSQQYSLPARLDPEQAFYEQRASEARALKERQMASDQALLEKTLSMRKGGGRGAALEQQETAAGRRRGRRRDEAAIDPSDAEAELRATHLVRVFPSAAQKWEGLRSEVLGSGAELAKQQRELEQFKGALVSARSSEGAQSMVAQVRLQNLDEREQGLSVQMRAHPYACKCSVCTKRADEARLREAKETLEQQRYLNSLTAGMFAEQTAVELRAERGEAVQHPNVVPVGEDRAILRPQQRMPFKCR